MRLGGDAQRGVEPRVEPPPELGEVLGRQSWASRWAGSTTSISTSAAVSSRSTSAIAATRRSRRGCRVVRAMSARVRRCAVEEFSFREPAWCEPHRTDAPVALVLVDGDEPRGLEGAQQATEIARVEAEPRASCRTSHPSTPISQSTGPRRAAGPGRGSDR